MRFDLTQPFDHQKSTCGWCGGFINRIHPTFHGKDSERHYCSEKCLVQGEERSLRYRASLAGKVSSHYIVGAIALAVFMVVFTTQAYPHDFYHHWKQPGTNVSCCNERKMENGVVTGDCIETRAEMRNGTWFAYLTHEGRWVEIPDNRIIRERNPTGESAHLCFSYGKVLCFVPPDTGG